MIFKVKLESKSLLKLNFKAYRMLKAKQSPIFL